MNPIWWQAFAGMVLWIGLGVVMQRRSDWIRAQLRSWPKGRLMFFGSVGFLLSGALLFGALVGIAQAGWWTQNGLTWLGWLVMALAGAGFVALQVLAAASMLTIVMAGQNRPGPRTSNKQD